MADTPPIDPTSGDEGGDYISTGSEYSTSDSEESYFDEAELQELESSQIEPGIKARFMEYVLGSRRRKNRRKDKKLKKQKRQLNNKIQQVDAKLDYVQDVMDKMNLKADLRQKSKTGHLKIKAPEFGLGPDDKKVLPPGEERKPPQYTLSEIMKNKMIDIAFPRARFDGTKGMGVREFIDAMDRGQKACFLTESDFKEVLAMKCIGHPYKMVSNWIRMGSSAEFVYNSLYERYNTDLPPIEAQNSLTVYRPYKGMNFSEMTGDIEDKARQASLGCEEEQHRKEFYNNIAIMALSNGLPPNSTRYVQEEKARLYLEHGRPCTYQELVSGLSGMYDSINLELKSCPQGFQYGKQPNKSHANTNTKGSEFTAHHKQGGLQRGYQKHTRVNQLTLGPHDTDDTVYVNAMDAQPGPSRQYSGKSYNNYKPGGFQGKSQRVSGGKHYCSLCGGYDHNPVDMCSAMRDDRGKVIVAPLSTGPCQICKSKINCNLFHNEAYCHVRDKMIELYRIGKVNAQGKALEYINNLPGFKKTQGGGKPQNGNGQGGHKPNNSNYNNSNGNGQRYNNQGSNQQHYKKKNDSSYKGNSGFRPKNQNSSQQQ